MQLADNPPQKALGGLQKERNISMKILGSITLALALCALVMAAPAQAKKPDHVLRQEMYQKAYEHGYNNYQRDDHRHEYRHGRDDSDHHVRFDDRRRDNIRIYLNESYQRKCPHGLAKKSGHCMPLGQARKYRIGDTIPNGYRSLPRDLLVRMGPPPSGTYYAMVDQDVFLVTEATKKILDAVTLFSAME